MNALLMVLGLMNSAQALDPWTPYHSADNKATVIIEPMEDGTYDVHIEVTADNGGVSCESNHTMKASSAGDLVYRAEGCSLTVIRSSDHQVSVQATHCEGDCGTNSAHNLNIPSARR